MKLRNKATLAFLISIALSMGILLVVIYFSFSQSFDRFLIEQQNFQFERISQELNKVFMSRDGNLYVSDLRYYAYSEQIYIEVTDDGDNVVKIDGLPIQHDPEEYIEKSFALVNHEGIRIGTIKIGYISDPYHANASARDFIDRIITTALLAIIVTIGVGLIAADYFSRNLTTPLEKMISATKRIREGKYDTLLPQSDIKELQELSDTIIFLETSLKAQEVVRKSYAQDIAHELRTPLTNLQLHLEAIKDGVIEADEGTFDLLLTEIQRLNAMVTKLRDSFNENVLSLQVKNQEINLSQVTDQIVQRFAQSAAEKEIRLIRTGPEGLILNLDEEKYNQILNNLISNALKATPPQGQVVVHLRETPANVVVSVKDNGCGIPPQDLPRIFDRFYRVDSARNSQVGGHGLGLSIVRNLVHAMGGEISVFSKEHTGTEFIVQLPK